VLVTVLFSTLGRLKRSLNIAISNPGYLANDDLEG